MGTVFTYPTVFLATAPAVSSSLNAKGRDSLHEVHVHANGISSRFTA